MLETIWLVLGTGLVLSIFVTILAIILRNRESAHCGLCGLTQKNSCIRQDCPRTKLPEQHEDVAGRNFSE